MKTAKITKVVGKKDFTNSYGTTIYHQLQMDNGDKIEIGKKKELKEGWELTYEITDEGFEYMKAKTAKADQPFQAQPNAFSGSNTTMTTQLNVQNLIVAQSSVASACNLLQQSSRANSEEVLKVAEEIYKFVMSKG